MSGAGNTFTVIDNRDDGISLEKARQLAGILCSANETNPYATEGLMLIGGEGGSKDFNVEFFNPDGSHGAMCGNGGRCAVMLAAKLGIIEPDMDLYKFGMAGSEYSACFAGSNVRLYLPPPVSIDRDISIPLAGGAIKAAYVDVNSDHAVINIDCARNILEADIEEADLTGFAIPIRHHKMFAPRGVNVNLYKILDKTTLRLRTYERGVEAETGACGTGSVSTAIIASLRGEVTLPVKIIPPSGIPVWADTILEASSIVSCILEGPAEIFDMREIEI